MVNDDVYSIGQSQCSQKDALTGHRFLCIFREYRHSVLNFDRAY